MSRRILVIEDEIASHGELAKYLRAQGHRVLFASDGKTGLNRILKEDFDLVLLDLKLPGIEGFDVLKEAKAVKPDLPIIILTGYLDPEFEFKAYKLGASFYMRKPFLLKKLNEAIERILDASRGQKGR